LSEASKESEERQLGALEIPVVIYSSPDLHPKERTLDMAFLESLYQLKT
jgi:hypothetical protein